MTGLLRSGCLFMALDSTSFCGNRSGSFLARYSLITVLRKLLHLASFRFWSCCCFECFVDLNELSAAAVNVGADSIAIIDADDSNGSEKRADLMTATAGAGLAAAGVLSVDIDELGWYYLTQTEDPSCFR